MTRDNDTFISLEERTQIASRENADLFVSVHANASPARSISGLETYSAEDLNFTDKAAVQRKTNEHLLLRNLSIKKGDPNVEGIISDMLYAHKQSESWRLAQQVAQQATKRAKIKNRGAKTARFHVLRNTLVPAVLIEVGFLTNPKEEMLLKTDDYRQKVALNLADSITDYVNGQQ
jgi:N-acetylmuramoyl-L-alanine amidase